MIYRWEDLKSKIKSLRSLKFNIFVLLIVVGLIPTIVLKYGIVQNYETRAVSVRTSEVQTQLKILANHLITYNYLQDTSSPVINAELEQLSNLYNGRVLIIGDNLKIVKDTYGISEGKTIISEEVVKCFKGESMSNYDADHGYIEMTIPISEMVESTEENEEKSGEPKEEYRGAMLISVSCDTIQKTMDILNSKATVLQLIMMVIIIGLAFFLAGFLVKPLNKVTAAINEVKGGYSYEAIQVPDYAETVHIIDAFNQLLGRMKILDDTRQEFVSNVSHELKTPLTSMKVLADSLNSMEDAPIELYKEFMGDIGNEIDRETKIINDLLSLVKMDKSAADLNVTNMNINELLEQILKRLNPIAEKQNVELVLESFRPVSADVDEVKITLAFTNLIENAIKYNKPGGWVHVTLNADHQYFYLKVEDSGIGIPEDSLEHIYERFYRVDKSHSREIGGTGLGLAITRNAVLMHRGAIKVFSTEGEGTIFNVRIPLNYIA